jgi:serine/threonine protein kinase
MSKEYNVIGEGSFGCAIKPSLPCSNKNITYKRKISKVMTADNAVKEMEEYKNIANIDKEQKYYLGVPTKCHVKKNKKTIKAIKKCKNLKSNLKKSVEDSMPELNLLVMKDGGVNLKTLANKIESMEINEKNQQKVKKIWIEMMKLFDGIMAFQKYGFAHHDLKPQNIVYSSKLGVHFIDFGHMRNMMDEKKKAINSDNWIYDGPFWNYPLEIEFLNKDAFMKFGIKTDDEKNAIFINTINELSDKNDKKKRNNQFVKAFSNFINYVIYNRNDSDKDLITHKYLMAYYKMMIEQIKSENYELFLDKSIKTIDVYGLGMTFFYLLNCSRKFLKGETIEQMEQCFFNMTTPNLFERYTIMESRTHFEKIIEDI